uniref:Diaminopimelate decarboxylase n=1 Tax=Lygus hesperus TaxID=30085 RepID=A0A0A9Y2G6_LYGHE
MALQRPCYLNVDNFSELDRIIALHKGTVSGFPALHCICAIVGIRVNPQTVTQTANTALATGGVVSKFGVALHDADNKQRIIDYVVKYHNVINLRMIHVHSGSQGLSLNTMVAGVTAIMHELIDNTPLSSLIDVIDIGGGFPVDFSSDDETHGITMINYV